MPCGHIEDPELAAHHVHGDVVDRHAVDVTFERPVMRVPVHDELRPVLADRAGEALGAEDEPQPLRLADERRFHR
jgi:hypothetical protein